MEILGFPVSQTLVLENIRKNMFTLCMLGNFPSFSCNLLTFSVIFFKKVFHEYNQSVKWFGTGSGLTFCWSSLICVKTVCKGYQQMTKNAASKDRVKHLYVIMNNSMFKGGDTHTCV